MVTVTKSTPEGANYAPSELRQIKHAVPPRITVRLPDGTYQTFLATFDALIPKAALQWYGESFRRELWLKAQDPKRAESFRMRIQELQDTRNTVTEMAGTLRDKYGPEAESQFWGYLDGFGADPIKSLELAHYVVQRIDSARARK